MLSNLDAIFLPAVFRLAAAFKDTEKLFLKKLTASWTARGVCERYLQEGVLEDLVRIILEKKLALIAKAKAADEVERAIRQPRPRYHFGTWEDDPFCLPEEELVMWLIASANNKLRPEAVERCMELFDNMMGGGNPIHS